MIVTCPNCAARYRLSDAALARPARLRCAACDHRWVPEATPEPAPPSPVTPPIPLSPPVRPRGPVTEADEEAAFLAVQEQIRARWHDAATPVVPVPVDDAIDPPEPDTEAPPEAEPPPRSPKWLRNVVAVIAGTALAIAAAGLWIGRQDLTAVPVVGDAVVMLAPPVPVTITVTGTTAALPSGRLVLEVDGAIVNPGKAAVTVPALTATLSGPDGVALRWTIPAPRRNLGPGQQVAFSSNVTGFPEAATKLTVVAAR